VADGKHVWTDQSHSERLEDVALRSQIESAEIVQLRPSPHNARTHSPRQIKQIEKSIKHFGFTIPVLIDEAGQILAGHGRVQAVQRLGWKTVPVIRVEHLNDAQKRAYIIADNELAARAGWDRDTLAIELQSLIDLEFDLDLTGFEGGEIDIILGDRSAAQHSEDAVYVLLGSQSIPSLECWGIIGSRQTLTSNDPIRTKASVFLFRPDRRTGKSTEDQC
jgi:hypothetical protein